MFSKKILSVGLAVASLVTAIPQATLSVKAKSEPFISSNYQLLQIGEKTKLKVYANKDKLNIKWKSKNPKICKVNKNGVIKAVKPGKTSVIAKMADYKFKCKVEVLNEGYEIIEWPGLTPNDIEIIGVDKEEVQEVLSPFAVSQAVLPLKEANVACGATYDFTLKATKEFLMKSKETNPVYSPANIYAALSLLAASASGESREEILKTVGAESIDELQDNLDKLWMGNYQKSLQQVLFANSLWLSDSVVYNEAKANEIAKKFYASTFKGQMGSAEYDKALQTWINANTGGLLSEEAGGLSMPKETVLSLASTLYLKAKWADEFSKSATKDDIFHAPTGDETVPFMNEFDKGNVYLGENFKAIRKGFENGGGMWIILPEEGVATDDVLNNSTGMFDMVYNKDNKNVNCKRAEITLKLPKFDVKAETSLLGGLQKMGVKSVFSASKADFSELIESSDAFVSDAKHAARVKIDEEGCEAAAYTMMPMCGTAFEELDKIEFICDRPFVFVVTGKTDDALFVGVVNNPTK